MNDIEESQANTSTQLVLSTMLSVELDRDVTVFYATQLVVYTQPRTCGLCSCFSSPLPSSANYLSLILHFLLRLLLLVHSRPRVIQTHSGLPS